MSDCCFLCGVTSTAEIPYHWSITTKVCAAELTTGLESVLSVGRGSPRFGQEKTVEGFKRLLDRRYNVRGVLPIGMNSCDGSWLVLNFAPRLALFVVFCAQGVDRSSDVDLLGAKLILVSDGTCSRNNNY
eukprot:6455149-Amphidinium_carterae.1